jgi:uncharacterized membrane protein (DUF2068 family)
MDMTKPLGIMIIAISSFLAAAFGAIMGTRPLLALIRQQVKTSEASSGWAEIGAALVLFSFVFPILYALAGWGLWKLKNWGRVLTIILAGIAAAFQLVRWLLASHVSVATVFSPSLFVVILFYLTRPRVVAAFTRASGTVRQLDQSV